MRVLLALALSCGIVSADEGMWTFDNFPAKKLGAEYGFTPSQEWLDHVRLSSVRLAEGCSASFISPNGLVLTNHHCAASCIQELSSSSADYSAKGFLAKTEGEEHRCPTQEANVLVGITEVTARIEKATRGLDATAANNARKAETSRIEKECSSGGASVRCDVVALYGGGVYSLYKYRRYQDVRLVMAPETSIAAFGGDPDNFNFPRYDLDMTFFRIYENGRPLNSDHYFAIAKNGSAAGDLAFVSGNPGHTNRQHTIARLETERDFLNFNLLLWLAEYRGLLLEFANRGEEQRRISEDELLYAENSLKAITGEERALLDRAFFATLVAKEREFRAKVDANPALQREYGSAWDEIAKAVAAIPRYSPAYAHLEGGRAIRSDLFRHARNLVRMAEESQKPDEKRLPEYTEARRPQLNQALASTAPVYAEFEIERLSWSLDKMREKLGPDSAAVRALFGNRSPREIATEAVKGTKLADPLFRKRLMEGGKAAIEASGDPMIALARQVDPYARAARKKVEDEIDSVIARNEERLAKARFAVYGSTLYPDATFTPRLNYGTVKGWDENGVAVKPYTTMGGAFERATGRFPFALPASWLEAKPRLNLETPFNLVTDNDVVGGNSGSPMIDRQGRLIGLVFDGNIHSLGGNYGFDERVNRTVAVDVRAIVESLGRVYGAERLIREMKTE
jgi:hypothetical protein